MDRQEALKIYERIREVSHLALDELGIDHEPHKPVERTCKWEGEGPIGVAYHYTGGPSGVKSARWFNDPSWGNTGSSCHVLVLDRLPDDPMGEAWNAADAEILRLFPAPAIVLADWRWGTWCTNWINRWCLGVELRNVGYGVAPLGPYKLQGKTPEIINTLPWEPYTRSQMISAINVGRLVRAMASPLFDRDYIVGHSMVWATKSDPGPAFPLHRVRTEIAIDRDPLTAPWIAYYTEPELALEDRLDWKPTADLRHTTEPDRQPSGKSLALETDPKDAVYVAAALYDLGYPTGPEAPTPEKLAKFVRWYQRSTAAWAPTHPDRVLAVDGVVGPKTLTSINDRLRRLRLRP